jgi:hypothetical protein
MLNGERSQSDHCIFESNGSNCDIFVTIESMNYAFSYFVEQICSAKYEVGVQNNRKVLPLRDFRT